MKITALWWGGASYAQGTWSTDGERFDSLADAVAEYDRRRTCGGYYPCVEGSEMQIVFGHFTPQVWCDVYPDRIICEGPRGGVRVERV